MAPRKEHLLLRVIKYGYENEEFTMDDLFGNLNCTQADQGVINRYIHNQGQPIPPNKLIILKQDREEGRFYNLDLSAVFHYVDYLELKEARKTAKRAQRSAMIAIAIATVTLLFSIHFSNKQINTPASIDLASIQQLQYDDSQITNKLDELKEVVRSTNTRLDSLSGSIENQGKSNK